MLIDKKAFDALSAADQKIVTDAFGRSFARLDKTNRDDNASAREALKSAGHHVLLARRRRAGAMGRRRRRCVQAADGPATVQPGPSEGARRGTGRSARHIEVSDAAAALREPDSSASRTRADRAAGARDGRARGRADPAAQSLRTGFAWADPLLRAHGALDRDARRARRSTRRQAHRARPADAFPARPARSAIARAIALLFAAAICAAMAWYGWNLVQARLRRQHRRIRRHSGLGHRGDPAGRLRAARAAACAARVHAAAQRRARARARAPM